MRRILGVALSALAGAAIAVQTRINGDLGERLDDGVGAAVISFGSGLLLLALVVPLLPVGRRGIVRLVRALRAGRLRPWHCLGGACGGFFVASQGLTVPSLGVALFTVAVVAGQAGSSLAVDHAGLGPGGKSPLTVLRVAGAVIAVVAVVVAVWPRLGTPTAIGLAVLPALAGIGVAWQQAVNGRVRVAAGSALTAALVNFLAGTVVLVIAFLLRGSRFGVLPEEPYLYVGGVLGIVFIAIAASVVRYTGVLLLGLATIAGQVAGAVVLDLAIPRGSRPTTETYVGAALTLVAVGLVAGRRRRT